MMAFNFKRFKRFTEKKHRSGKIGDPTVSIHKSMQIWFNAHAMRRFELYDFDYAVLFFDEETKTVGIMLTKDDEEEGVYKLIKPKSGGYGLSVRRFLNFHEIDCSELKSYPLEYDEESNLYFFKIE